MEEGQLPIQMRTLNFNKKQEALSQRTQLSSGRRGHTRNLTAEQSHTIQINGPMTLNHANHIGYHLRKHSANIRVNDQKDSKTLSVYRRIGVQPNLTKSGGVAQIV